MFNGEFYDTYMTYILETSGQFQVIQKVQNIINIPSVRTW